MTTDVRLLSTYKGFAPQSIISLPDTEATGLVSVGHASLTLTGGTRRYITVANRDTAAQKLPLGLHTVTQNQEMQVLIPEGQVVTLTGGASAAATVTRNGTADSWTIGASGVRTIGPYLNQQVLTVQCTAGAVTAENHDAGATAVQIGQNSGAIAGGAAQIGSVTNSGATQNSTWCHVFSAWGDFNAVQLVFENSSASSETIDAVTVAPSTTIYPAGVNNIAAAQGGGSWSTPLTALTVPAGSSARTPAYYATAKIPCRSLPRAAGELDGGKYPLLLVRDFRATGNTNAQYMSLNAAMAGSGWDSVNEGFTLQFGRAPSGDKVTTPSSLTSLTREGTNPIVTVHGVIFTYDQKMTSIMPIGDSIWAGALDGGTNNCPFGFKAAARIRNSGKKVSFVNGGIASSTALEINTRGKALIDLYAPDIIVIASNTVNSATATQADWDAQWYYFMDLAQYQLAKGKQVVMLTPLPNNAYTSAINGYRLTQRQRVINSGLPYADVEAATVDVAGGQGRWIAGLAADSTHPAPAGHEAISAVLRPVLDSLIK